MLKDMREAIMSDILLAPEQKVLEVAE